MLYSSFATRPPFVELIKFLPLPLFNYLSVTPGFMDCSFRTPPAPRPRYIVSGSLARLDREVLQFRAEESNPCAYPAHSPPFERPGLKSCHHPSFFDVIREKVVLNFRCYQRVADCFKIVPDFLNPAGMRTKTEVIKKVACRYRPLMDEVMQEPIIL